MSQSAKRPRNDVSGSATTINDLCDDVLREIFRYLSTSKLRAIANVCRSFYRNVQAELPSRYKEVNFYDEVDSYAWRNDPAINQKFHFRQMAPVLQRFGSSIVSIGIIIGEFSAESSHLMDLLIEYCGESLKELRLEDISFTSDMVLKLRPLLSRLEVLKLSYCEWELEPLAMEILADCSELHTIELKHVQKFIDHISFPKLRSLSVIEYFSEDPNESLKRLLASSPLLEKIKIHDINGGCGRGETRLILSIVAHTPQIEKISLSNSNFTDLGPAESAKQLKRLTSLKSLRIDCWDELFTPALKELAAARVPLENLRLEQFRSNAEFVNEISKWTHLKKLGLVNAQDLPSADVLTIVRNLSELTKLSLCIDTVKENDLVEIVRCAPKLQKLKWKMSGGPILTGHILDVDWFLQIRDVLANRTEKSPALLLSLGNRLNVAKELRKANEDFLKIRIWDE